MTYHELIQDLSRLTPDQLDSDLTIYIHEQDEYYPAKLLLVEENDGRLDAGHPVFGAEHIGKMHDKDYQP